MSDQTATTGSTDELLAELQSQVEAYERGSATAEYSPQGRILRANDAFAELVGADPAAIVGTDHRSFVSPEVAASAEYTELWDQLRSGGNSTGEFRLVWQGSRDRWIRSSWVPVKNRAGQVVKVVEHALDVTPGKRAAADAQGKIQAITRSQAVIEFDLGGHILDANDNFLALVGYARDEVVGRHHRMFVSDQDAQSQAYQEFWRKLGAGEFVSGEFHRYGKDGRDVWLQAVYSPILGIDGKPWKVVKFAVDVTEAKTRNADFEGKVTAIRRSQAVIEFDLAGTVLEANDAFLDLMGYRQEEIAGRHHRIFVDPAEAGRPEYKSFWEMLARGEFHSAEYRRIAKDGSEVWIRATYNPILDADGKPVKVVKFANDVTAEKLRNVELAGRLAAIDRSQAVIEFDLDGRIRTANDNFLRTVGYSLDEIVGRHHSMFCTPEYAESDEYLGLWAALRTGEFRSGRFHRLGRDGRDVWLQSSYNPILDLSGKPVKVIKYAYDVTEQVRLEQRLSVPV
ncbi:PAS domain-containing protein [Paractinoplanes lichenicola]|uniref:PAS domain-containing protein n=1 Tax=Paractinoplanes lichenicola TaxID=2802976 RepID=A0ABS1VFT8_9ACTN|nr:PAS domain-containing protein [Actinoplanes lichenicola]MBL7253567.1 PAS domain-containing protein [Actinoplanes lichenicola]